MKKHEKNVIFLERLPQNALHLQPLHLQELLERLNRCQAAHEPRAESQQAKHREAANSHGEKWLYSRFLGRNELENEGLQL